MHHELFDMLTEYRRVAAAAPTSFAKSTCTSVGFAMHLILYTPGTKVLLLSNTGSLAVEWLRIVRDYLETDAQLIEDFGDQRTAIWRQDHLVLANGSELTAKGAGFQLRGWRPHVIIADDLENDEGVRSEEQRKKLLDWFNSALTNRLDPKGQLVVIGTVLHERGLLAGLLKRRNWKTKRYQALVGEGEDERSIWPAKWSVEELHKRRAEIGSIAFAKDFMNDPWPESARCFPAEWFANTWVATVPRGVEWYVGLDPAFTQEDTSDYTAWVAGGLHRETGHVYVAAFRDAQWTTYQTIRELLGLKRRFVPLRRVGIEAVAAQRILREVALYTGRQGEGNDLPLLDMPAEGDHVTRARSVSHLCESGRVHFVQGTDRLFANVTEFPQVDHDDLTDGFVYMLKVMMRSYQFGYPVKEPPPDVPPRDPWQPLAGPVARMPGFERLWL